MTEEEFDKAINNTDKIAKVIWDNIFFTGLQELNQARLIVVIERLAEELDLLKNVHGGPDERDWKDKAFDTKWLIIETLDKNFFKRG